MVRRNDVEFVDLETFSFDAIVISPGPESPYKANNLMNVVERYLGQIPILGICLGHQALGLALGGKLVKAQRPMHGMLSSIQAGGDFLFNNLPSHFQVVRYHSLIIEDLPDDVDVVAKTESKELMAFESKEKRCAGLQFHPEAILTEYGLEILRNWLTFYNIV